MDQQQQQTLLLQQRQQQQQNPYLLLQQLQKQAHQQQQAAAISRFPSNIDAHLRSPGFHILNSNRPPLLSNPNSNSNSSPNPNPQQQSGGGEGGSGLTQNPHPQSQQQQPQSSQLQKSGGRGMMMMRPPPVNQAELQMAYQDAWRVCHPDFKRPFSSLEDACERLLPYHVVADYEAEEDDRILDSDTTGLMPSRCQQWDHNISAKVAEFTGTFEKQALAFNIITRKRALGEFRSEERLMIEQALLQEEKHILLDLKTEIDARDKAGREAQLRMAAMVQSEHARGPIRASALDSQGNNNVHDMGESNVNQEEMLNGWGNNLQRDEKEPSEDFLNDEENENADTGVQVEWSVVGDFDLNTR